VFPFDPTFSCVCPSGLLAMIWCSPVGH